MSVYRTWDIPSSTDPSTRYSVTERDDTVHGGTYLHCVCKGWGPARGKGRDCRHVASVRLAEGIADDAALRDNRARAVGYANDAAAVASTGKAKAPDTRIFAGENMKRMIEDEDANLPARRYTAYDVFMRGDDIVSQRYDVFHAAERQATTVMVRWHVMAANELHAMSQAIADGRTAISAIGPSEQFQLGTVPDFDTTEWADNTERKARP